MNRDRFLIIVFLYPQNRDEGVPEVIHLTYNIFPNDAENTIKQLKKTLFEFRKYFPDVNKPLSFEAKVDFLWLGPTKTPSFLDMHDAIVMVNGWLTEIRKTRNTEIGFKFQEVTFPGDWNDELIIGFVKFIEMTWSGNQLIVLEERIKKRIAPDVHIKWNYPGESAAVWRDYDFTFVDRLAADTLAHEKSQSMCAIC